MPDGFLTFEHGIVTLGEKELPGILQSQGINNGVRFDEAQQDGDSGKKKTPLGWGDSDISLSLQLPTDEISTCYEKLAELDAIYKGHNNGGFPRIYDISNPHMIARGIHQVVFAGLDSSETDNDDIIIAALKFTEHDPPIIKAKKQGTSKTGSTPDTKTGKDPDADPDVAKDDVNPLIKKLKDGFNDASGDD